MAGRILLSTYASLCPDWPEPDDDVEGDGALANDGKAEGLEEEEPKPKSSPMAEPDERDPNPKLVVAPLIPDVKPNADDDPVGVALPPLLPPPPRG